MHTSYCGRHIKENLFHEETAQTGQFTCCFPGKAAAFNLLPRNLFFSSLLLSNAGIASWISMRKKGWSRERDDSWLSASKNDTMGQVHWGHLIGKNIEQLYSWQNLRSLRASWFSCACGMASACMVIWSINIFNDLTSVINVLVDQSPWYKVTSFIVCTFFFMWYLKHCPLWTNIWSCQRWEGKCIKMGNYITVVPQSALLEMSP